MLKQRRILAHIYKKEWGNKSYKKVHLCGMSVVTAYLVDIFTASSIPPLSLLLVSSFSGRSIWRYRAHVLTSILSEMGFSFLQLAVADSLGRWPMSYPSNSHVCTFESTRKTFLIICGLGIGATTLIFAAVFATVSQSDDIVRKPPIFWAKSIKTELFVSFHNTSTSLFIFFHQVKNSLPQTFLDVPSLTFLLSHPALILTNLSLYCCLYNIGFGPIKHTLLRWQLSQTSIIMCLQTNAFAIFSNQYYLSSTRQWAVLSDRAENSRWFGHPDLLVRKSY